MDDDDNSHIYYTNIISLEDVTKHLADQECTQVSFGWNTVGLDFENGLMLKILTREVTAPPAPNESADGIIKVCLSKFLQASEEIENIIKLTFEAGVILITKSDLEGDTLDLWASSVTQRRGMIGNV